MRRYLLGIVACFLSTTLLAADPPAPTFRAGAATSNITPALGSAIIGGSSVCLVGKIAPTNAVAAEFHAVPCEGTYPHHLQGICTNERDAIYWSFTTI